jgi:serine/threonine protein phosphatase PrpC
VKAISNITEVSPSQVLYHTAFGFASVTTIDNNIVRLHWEQTATGLPESIDAQTLCRVYQRCPRGGFFDLAVNDPTALRHLTHLDPTAALDLLLRDIDVPLTRDDATRWFTCRGLVSAAAFGPWWQRIAVLAKVDPRFSIASDTISLHNPNARYADSLDDERLGASDRIALAQSLRAKIGDTRLIEQLIQAIPAASTPVKRLAIDGLNEFDPNTVLPLMLNSGEHHLDTLIFTIRNAAWDPNTLNKVTTTALIERVLVPIHSNASLSGEPRLGAALVTWGVPDLPSLLLSATTSTTGRRLIRATIDVLSTRHGLALLDSLGSIPGLPAASRGFIDRAKQKLHDAFDILTPTTNRRTRTPGLKGINASRTLTPTALQDLPSERAMAIVDLGAAVSKAVAKLHSLDMVVNPTGANVIIHPNGDCTIDHAGLADLPNNSPHLPNENPSMARDIYGCASLLLGTLIGKDLDPKLSADAYLPYVRQISPFIPPAALAPLSSALNPNPAARPDAQLWELQWMAVLDAENARSASTFNGSQSLSIGYDTHVGRLKMLMTQTNQDALFVSSFKKNSVMMVSDGISTATAGSGDLASAITGQILSSMWEHEGGALNTSASDRAGTFIDEVLTVANRSVCETSVRLAAGSLDGKIPMGATVTVAISQGNLVSLASLGDSRAYLVGPYGASLLTVDQTQARDRLIEWAAGQRKQWRKTGAALVGYIGHFDENYEPTPIPAIHRSFTMLAGETLIICSDGITNFIASKFSDVSDLLTQCVAEHEDENEIARALINLANRGGGGDNATVIVARAHT